MAVEASADDVFTNCPFDDEFAPTFRALLFTIMSCGFRPRSARELDDGGQTRIDKIYGLIETCRYGIHDLSRTELDAVNNLPRFNMPLELGLFLGAKRFGNKAQKLKRVLILDVEQHRYQRFISDLAGMDIHGHAGEPMSPGASCRARTASSGSISRSSIPCRTSPPRWNSIPLAFLTSISNGSPDNGLSQRQKRSRTNAMRHRRTYDSWFASSQRSVRG